MYQTWYLGHHFYPVFYPFLRGKRQSTHTDKLLYCHLTCTGKEIFLLNHACRMSTIDLRRKEGKGQKTMLSWPENSDETLVLLPSCTSSINPVVFRKRKKKRIVMMHENFIITSTDPLGKTLQCQWITVNQSKGQVECSEALVAENWVVSKLLHSDAIGIHWET